MWRCWKNICWWSGGCWTTPSWWQRLHTMQWHSRLSAYVCVNGGHFERKFWTYDFLVCFVCFIDTGFRKFDRHKHAQSANIGWNVLLLCLRLLHNMVATKRVCGRKFLHQALRHSLAKLRTKNYKKYIYIRKSYRKRISGTFVMWTRCKHKKF